MGNIAYALREEFAGTITQYETEKDKAAGKGTEVDVYSGGVINLGPEGPEGDLDVKAALEEGDGLIIVPEDADPRTINALDEYPALKRVKAPADSEPSELLADYDNATVTERRDELKRRGVDKVGALSGDEATAVLEHHDALVEAGVNVPDGIKPAELLELEVEEPGGEPEPNTDVGTTGTPPSGEAPAADTTNPEA